MENTKILLAGPGTGKTTKVKQKVKEKLKENSDTNILVISFTNATVEDLLSELNDVGITENSCRTLHSYALYLNHATNVHILESNYEVAKLADIAKALDIEFDALCKILDCMTFDQMIKNSVNFIRANPTYAEEKIGTIDLLLVDEYQDFNENERELVEEVMKFAKETIVLGDDDQSIYDFKDADAKGIMDLFRREDIVRMEHDNICYRCPKDLVLSLNNLITNNKDRILKELKPHQEHTGVSFHQTKTQMDTNELIFGQIKEIRDENAEGSILVLSSIGFASEPIIEFLENKELPITNMWELKIDLDTMREIWWIQTIFGEKKLLSTAFLALDAAKYTYQRKKIYDLLKKSAIQGTSETAIVKGLIGLSFMNSPLVPYVYSDISTEDFIKNMPAFEKYGEYLVADNPSYGLGKLPYLFKKTDSFNTSKINFMSIHKSKGLSAHHVFIVGLVDGILPRGSESTNTLESQRRLFFVGASRAKQSLRLFSQMEWASSLIHKVDRSKFKYRGKDKVIGQTSPFVTELKLTN